MKYMAKQQTVYLKILRPEFTIIKADSPQQAAQFFKDQGCVVVATSLRPLDPKDIDYADDDI